jgi:hypothetical protein
MAQSIMLPVVGIGALYLRHRRLAPELAPGRLVTIGLWLATAVMAVVGSYSLWLVLRGA